MRTRRNSWASLFALTSGCVLAASACSDQAVGIEGQGEDLEQTSEGVIIGSNDLVRVGVGGAGVPDKYKPVINAIGRLAKSATGSGFCSATHLGNGIAVSAGHCWSAGATRQNNISCATGSTCANQYVQWGATSGGIVSTSKVTSIKAMQVSSGTNKLDYAYFEVSPIPPDHIPVDWAGKGTAGTTLTIFSHPSGRTMEWSTTCALQSPSKTQLSYQCDTEPGSSGASVLNDSALAVNAIHWGGAASGNIATFILETPVREFLQPDGGGGTGGSGGADGGGDGGKADGGGAGGADGGDASTDGPRDGSTDGSADTGGDGAGGSAGAAGAAGASGSGGSAGSAGSGGAAGTGGGAGKGGASGSGGSAGKGGAAGATGGSSGSAGTGGATGGTGGATGGTSGASGSGGSAGSTGGTGGSGKGGSTSGSGGSAPPSDDGCSCSVVGGNASSSNAGGMLAALAVGIVGLRRSRRKKNDG
jgi:MYXO-CTERM domain-containing protein